MHGPMNVKYFGSICNNYRLYLNLVSWIGMTISSERDGKEFSLPYSKCFSNIGCEGREIKGSQHRLPKVVIIHHDQYFR